jgi:hypothetical protein
MKAFPISNSAFDDEPSMDLRDYFAAKAMQSLLWNPDAGLDSKEDICLAAYEYADMMMEIRIQEIHT